MTASHDKSARACPMGPLAEARHDGRLGGADAERFDRHLETCASCRAVADDVALLADLVQSMPLSPSTPMERRRRRLRLLLAAAVPREEAPPTRRRTAGLLLAAAAFCVCSAVAIATALPGALAMRSRPFPERARHLVVATDGARVRTASPAHFDLDEGTLAVDSPGSAVVRVNGVDVGGRGGFVVEAANGRIARVAVSNGSAEFRNGEQILHLTSGGVWTAPVEVSRIDLVEAASAPEIAKRPVTPAVFQRSNVPAPAVTNVAVAPSAVAPAPKPSAAPAVEGPPSDSSFRDAVKLVERGAYSEAADRFAEFRRAQPSDPRAEDAAFLEVLAFDRAGKHDAARAAAKRYLAMYPKGFRRAEAETIAKSQ